MSWFYISHHNAILANLRNELGLSRNLGVSCCLHASSERDWALRWTRAALRRLRSLCFTCFTCNLDVSGCISAGFSIILLIFFQSCLNMYVCLFLLMKYHDMPCQALLLDAQKVGMQGPEAQLKTARAAATSCNSCCAGYCARWDGQGIPCWLQRCEVRWEMAAGKHGGRNYDHGPNWMV